jgi:hypothetical protein
MSEIVRRPAKEPWPLSNGMGNHRALIHVDHASNAAFVHIGWRRRDQMPEKIGVRLICLANNTEIDDIYTVQISRESGEFVFRAPVAGDYALYYMPFVIKGSAWWSPNVVYRTPDATRPDSTWLVSAKNPETVCTVIALESRTPFDLFDDMETPASKRETEELVASHPESILLFPEDRTHPIWMKYDLPFRWIQKGISSVFHSDVKKGEYFVFQIGVYAPRSQEELKITFENVCGINTEALTCFNAAGFDWQHRPFHKKLTVQAGAILPLWIGVDIPKDINENVCFDVIVSTNAENYTVSVYLNVKMETSEQRGDRNLRQLSRLRWLNSGIGMDDEICEGFEPVRFDNHSFHCIGRTIVFDDFGLPVSILSNFTPDGLTTQGRGKEILAEPIRFTFYEANSIRPTGLSAVQHGSGRYTITGGGTGDGFIVSVVTQAEFDGHLDTLMMLRAEKAISLTNVRLEIPMRSEVVQYMVGFAREGGRVPQRYRYDWNVNQANNMGWFGAPDAGLHVKLKHTQDVWELFSFKKVGLPDSWYNGGAGYAELVCEGGVALLTAYCGDKVVQPGETVVWRVAYQVTPLKPIDAEKHWAQRYYHTDTWTEPTPNLDEAKAGGANVVNLHHGGSLNAHINYPFLMDEQLRDQISRAHTMGLKYKIYYTVRELSNHAVELPALRALNGEILRDGPGFHIADHFETQSKSDSASTGGPWLCEHMPEGFIPAWHHIFADGEYDCAIATTGLSRWHNYYLEGLRWLITQVGIDGIYLDGVGYDREIMKRVRKTMDQAKPGCLIDFHSGNSFFPQYGSTNPIALYTELYPYVDRLWLGEGYDYEQKDPDYWLVEISGIPFGLMSEMLQDGGNQWRGMCFGMSCRLGWQQGGDPRALWRFWDDFGIEKTKMIGWWNPECPVQTGHEDIKATVFLGEDRLLVAVASWNPEEVNIVLSADAPKGWHAPGIEGYQMERDFAPEDRIPMTPHKGWLLIRK